MADLIRLPESFWRREADRVLRDSRRRYPWTMGKYDLPQVIGNYVQTSLSAGITNAATTLSVVSASGLSLTGTYRAVIRDLPPATTYEIVEVASVSGTTVTLSGGAGVGRGLEGTSAIAHSAGALFSNDITAYMLTAYGAQGVGNLGGGGTARASTTTPQGVFTALTDLTGLALSGIVVPAGRLIRVSCYVTVFTTVATDVQWVFIRDGSNVTLQTDEFVINYTGGTGEGRDLSVLLTPAAGTYTWKVSAQRASGTGNTNTGSSVTAPSYILAEDLGPAT